MCTNRTIKTTLLLLLAGWCSVTVAQSRTKYWTGGSGSWADPAHWSLVPQGPGGAGVPRSGEDVVIEPATATTIRVDEVAWCADLVVKAEASEVQLVGGERGELNIAGEWRLRGNVSWAVPTVRLCVRQAGVELDLRGIPLASQLVFDGTGSWSVVSDLVLQGEHAFVLKEGTLIGNHSKLAAGAMRVEGRKSKTFIAGRSVVMLKSGVSGAGIEQVVQPGGSTLVIDGIARPWGIPSLEEASSDRDINVCGTGPGQTPFIVNAQLTSNYNGFGVRCRGDCNGTVTVTVNQGVGPFTYQWLNGGPPTATWTTACGGPQIVIVTDVGQGISCPAQVNVSEPAPLGVIFFGTGTPPTCADVCDGSRTALGVGGVSPITYNWNNGAGTNSSFFELCAGANTLVITDANNCTFDTTFVFNIQPILPNLSVTNISCFAACDGTASVAPTGGTGAISVTWSPAPPVGQGTNTASGLCAGNYSVTLEDANGCDTTVTFQITEPPPIVPSVTSVDASCFGACDGSATASASGAVGPYAYAWAPAPGAGQGTGAVSGLCEGTYTVTITDQASGCTVTATVTINAPPAFDVQSTLVNASCAGSCDGSIALLVSGGTAPFTYLWTPVPASGQGTANVTGLCPGSWQVLISDAAGCDTTVSFTITAPPPIDPVLDITDVSCNGICDGAVTATVGGGTPPYTYVWSPAPPIGQGTSDVSGLCAGAYSLLLTDANGCDTTLQFNITQPPPLVLTPSQTNVSCGGVCDGTATVLVSGGTPGYTYVWAPAPAVGQGTPSAGGLCAGAYSVVVTDLNGCTSTAAFTILDAVPLQVTLQVVGVSCPGACDGTAAAIVTGGVAPYSYLWTIAPGTGQGTPNVTGLCAQAYALTITDAVGCDTTLAFNVPQPPPIVTSATVTNATCNGDCDGSIVLAVSGGAGSFTYLWTPVPPNGQGGSTATGLCPGVWDVTITSGACDTTLSFTITAPPPITVVADQTDMVCNGACSGAASVTVSGGTAPYSYAWSPAPPSGQGTPSASSLCAGAWSVLITDAVGCDTTVSFTIAEPPPLDVPLVLTPAGCSGACAGTATASPTGGVAPYTYVWSPLPGSGQGTPSAGGLCPGIYTLTLTDAVGCDTTIQFTIISPAGIDATPTVTDASCNGSCDGAIAISASGGVPPYAYTWDPPPPIGQGTASVSGLCAGNWTVQITDAAACDTFMVVVVNEPLLLELTSTFTNETCNGPCDGTATVVVSGGTAPYTYQWSPQPAAGQGTASVTGLCPGPWTILVTDASGCTVTEVIDILPIQGVDANAQIVSPTCVGSCDGSITVVPFNGIAPYSYSWSPAPGAGQGTDAATQLCAGSWSVTVTDAVGCDTTLSYVLTDPPPFVVDLTTTSETCVAPCTGTAAVTVSGGTGPPTYFWQPAPGAGQGTATVTGLCSGTTYSLTIGDASGCDTTISFTVDPFDAILANSSSTPASCVGTCDGTATVGPTGGQAPYTYLWSPAPGGGQGTAQATGLCPGPVQVIITDANGCAIAADILILAPPALVVDAVVAPILCGGQCDGSIALNTSGGTAPYAYVWSPAPPIGQGTATAEGLCAGNWSVTVTDANGCDSTLVFDLVEPAPLSLSVAVTPSQCQLCSGAAQLTLSGGTPFFLVEWTDALGNVIAVSDNIANVCAGLYGVTVTDGNGCTAQAVVPITDSDGEVLTTTDGATNCPDGCDGSVSVAFTCSAPPCTIAWSDALGNDLGQNTATATGLCPGDYYVTVVNGTGCISIDTASVIAPPDLQANISTIPVACAGECTGSAAVGIAGGTPPYTFLWDPPPAGGQGTPVATGLCAGVYNLTIGFGAGCDTTVSILMLEPLPLTVDALGQDISCNGSCDGSITLNTAGGTAPYSFFWSPAPPDGQGTSTATGLCAGDWTATVTDANGCSIQVTVTIAEPAALTVSASATSSNCQVCDGSASAIVSGGTAPFLYAWSQGGTVVSTDADATALCSGAYTVSVTDANGCSATASVTVADADGEVLTMNDGQVACASDCNGTIGVALVCSDPPCTLVWTDGSGAVIAQDVDVVTGLCPGDYQVQVTNASGCTSFGTAVVAPATVILPNLGTTPVSCPGVCDGTATVGPTGGSAPYGYNWDPAPGAGQGTAQATGLCSGTYVVTITDANGCTSSATALILEPAPLLIAATLVDVSCAAACTGSITLTPSGGVAPYAYVWSPVPPNGQGGNAATTLCAGDYTVTVTDAGGCTSVQTYTIVEPSPLSLTGASVPSACGICDGEASIVVAGGVAPYTYVWTLGGVIYGTDTAITALCAGIYLVEVTDANGCTASLGVPVPNSDGEVTSTTDGVVTCPGDCDGSVSVDLVCSDPPCTIAWTDALGNDLGVAGNVADNLCAGTYFVLVTNASGCVTIDTAMVSGPEPILPNLGTTPVSCAGACDGTATVAPTGGAGGFGFVWSPDPPSGQGTQQVTGLCAGPWTVTITDTDGCSVTVDVLILEPAPLDAQIAITPPTCSADCDGSIVVTPAGGVAPYLFVWDPVPPNGQGTNEALDLCAGSWSVQITDASGCTLDTLVDLLAPDPIAVVLTTTDNPCFGDCVGTAQAIISGGVAPYAITWTDPLGADIAIDVDAVSALCAGDHTLTIVDANGCVHQVPFTIGQGAVIDAFLTTTSETCAGPCDGTAAVQPAGGQGGPYTITWSPDPPLGQGTTQASALCAGSWSVTITDVAGCSTTQDFTIDPYAPIADNALVTLIDCFGACNGSIALSPTGGNAPYAFVWTPVPPNGQGNSQATDLCPGAYTVTVSDATGCDSTFSYVITEPSELVLVVDSVSDASCATAADGTISITVSGGLPSYVLGWSGPGGFTSDQEDISGLLPGDYVLQVVDANGCVATITVTVNALIAVVADAGVDQNVCANAGIMLDGSNTTGATTYSWTNDQGVEVGNTAVVDLGTLLPGVYVFTLTATDGPCFDTDEVTITVFAVPPADAGVNTSIFTGTSVILGGSPTGPQSATYGWTPDSLLNSATSPNPTATPTTTTWFYVTVTSEDGCIATDSVLITVVPEVVIPSGFTPNNDGWNDTWVIDLFGLFPECEVEVYNRWGERLFRSVGYNQPWDGRFKGEYVPVGTYYYVVKLNHPEYPEPYTGPLTLIR